METFINPSKEKWAEIIQRPQIDNAALKNIVSEILHDVKQNGDKAIKKYALQFDGVALNDLKVNDEEIETALEAIGNELKTAIQLAKDNIEKFHQSQREEEKIIETTPGVTCWRRSVAVDKVGLYIPGGTAPLFSTLLMLGIPALLAGCREIVVCTPTDKNGKINSAILYVAHILGLKNIYKIGGVQAIAAMAYGTESISSVNKIFGPGNQYVTTAKQIISSEGFAIDIPAGPSELAVYADESCIPAFVASDLLSQAEHGNDSQVLLIASNKQIIDDVKKEIDMQLNLLSRKEIIGKSLINSCVVIMEKLDNAFDLLNEYAPEHLIIASDNAELLSKKVSNAGSVFLGHYSPESAGDYASGTNHTLPTNGYAKAFSGVSLDSFVKKITFQKLSKEGLNNIGNAVELMAEAEGLDAHRNAISIRLKK
ncbi:MAG TPA: histidinol dehydrogenase [Chitinophagaceae bacterium]|nr:histidinol dehydrogenase [Chitinophagaceae bacterium]